MFVSTRQSIKIVQTYFSKKKIPCKLIIFNKPVRLTKPIFINKHIRELDNEDILAIQHAHGIIPNEDEDLPIKHIREKVSSEEDDCDYKEEDELAIKHITGDLRHEYDERH